VYPVKEAASKWFRCWHSYWSHGLFYSFNEFQSYFLQNLPNSSFSFPWISFSTCLITHSRISVAGFLSRTGFQGQHTLCLISLSDQPDELWAPIQNAPLAIPCMCVCVWSHSVTSDSFATPWTVARQGPLSIEFSMQRILEWVAISYSRGCSWSPASLASAGGFFTTSAT